MGSEIILAPPGRCDFDVLSGTGAVLWELLAEPSTALEVVGSLARMYGVAEGDIAADVDELVDRLLRTGAIEQMEESNDADP